MGFIHVDAVRMISLSLGTSRAGARKARAPGSCDSTPSTGMRVTCIPACSVPLTLGLWVWWVFGEILFLSFTLVL